MTPISEPHVCCLNMKREEQQTQRESRLKLKKWTEPSEVKCSILEAKEVFHARSSVYSRSQEMQNCCALERKRGRSKAGTIQDFPGVFSYLKFMNCDIC